MSKKVEKSPTGMKKVGKFPTGIKMGNITSKKIIIKITIYSWMKRRKAQYIEEKRNTFCEKSQSVFFFILFGLQKCFFRVRIDLKVVKSGAKG